MISIVIGTRPEIIKMSPIIRACADQGLDYEILHTGQHYSYAMDRIFLNNLTFPCQHTTSTPGPAHKAPRLQRS